MSCNVFFAHSDDTLNRRRKLFSMSNYFSLSSLSLLYSSNRKAASLGNHEEKEISCCSLFPFLCHFQQEV